MKKNKMILKRIVACGLCAALLTGCSSGRSAKIEKSSDEVKVEDTSVEESEQDESNDKENGSSDFISGIKAKYAATEMVEYDNALYNLEKDHVFVFEDLPDYYFDNDKDECFGVYYDAELTKPVDVTIENDIAEKTVTISPNLTFDYSVEQSCLANDGTWGSRSKFWLVRNVDLESGEMLSKPVVTIFTIAQELDTPTLKQSVNDEGYYTLSWTEVEGADYYEVYVLHDNVDYAELEFKGDAHTTECNYPQLNRAIEYEKKFKEKYQNTELNLDDKWIMNEMLYENLEFFVVAKSNDGKVSGMSNDCDIDDILSQIPYQRSWDFQDEYEGDSILDLPAYVEVEMLDESSVGKYLIEYDGATVYLLEDGVISVWPSIKNLPIGMVNVILKGVDYEEFMSQTDLLKDREEKLEGKTGTATEDVDIPYVPKKDESNPSDEDVTTKKEKETTTKKQRETETTTEEETEETEETTTEEETDEEETEKKEKETKKKDSDKDEYDIDLPEELEETIFANSAIGEWTAYNLLAHNEVIPYEMFPESSDTEFLSDAFFEAYNQNPLCGIIETVSYDYDTDSLHVSYVLDEKDTKKMQEESLKKAKKIADEIIDDDMSDYEKEWEINKYLCENGEYNEAIFDYIDSDGTIDPSVVFDHSYSFTPYGILVEEVGVCESYSEAFLLVAHFAGLEAVIETGSMGGVNHEWNRVKIDNQWYVLDVTNNDSEYLPNCYFNVPDEIAETIYQKGKDAMMDKYISEYSAKGMDNEYYTKSKLYTEEKDKAVSMLTDLLNKDQVAAIRMNADLKEKDVSEIVKKVVKESKMKSGKYYYNAGVISIIKE